MPKQNISEDKLLDQEHFEILVEAEEDSPGFLKKMLEGYKKNGQESLDELKKSIDACDFSQIKFHAHKLKGLSGAIGASFLMKLASQAENLSSDENNLESLKLLFLKIQKAYNLCLDSLKKKIGD